MRNYLLGVALALVLWLSSCGAQEDYSVTVTGGNAAIYPIPESNIYGNNVTKYVAYLPNGAQKSWLNPDKPLPAGKLKAFYFYVHGISSEEQTRALLLQIWRPTRNTTSYQLVWQKSINFTSPANDGSLVTVQFEDGTEFETRAYDLIGWKYFTEIGFISFDFLETQKVIFTKPTQEEPFVPEVSQIYEFDNIYLPGVWAVAVQIEPMGTEMMNHDHTEPRENIYETDYSVAVTGGNAAIYPVPGANIYGNNVTKYVAYLPNGAQKSWLIPDKPLPAGKLKAFYFYVHGISSEEQTRAFLLQIWRPTSNMTSYQLVWQKSINFTMPANDGSLVTVQFEDGTEFETRTYDLIGWKYLTEIGFISFDYSETQKVLYTRPTQEEPSVPEVSQIYEFDNIHLPGVWAVAVQIEPMGTEMMNHDHTEPRENTYETASRTSTTAVTKTITTSVPRVTETATSENPITTTSTNLSSLTKIETEMMNRDKTESSENIFRTAFFITLLVCVVLFALTIVMIIAYLSRRRIRFDKGGADVIYDDNKKPIFDVDIKSDNK